MNDYFLKVGRILMYVGHIVLFAFLFLVFFYWMFIPDMDACSFHEEEPSWLVRFLFDFDSGFHAFPNWILFSFSIGLGVLITYLIVRKRNSEIQKS
jgi:cytochrome bd-type quinol oxidase subunit 2